MFGYPACFVNGNYFAGLYEDRVVIRLPGEVRTQAPELGDAEGFDPMGTGKPMKDWYVVPEPVAADERSLARVLAATVDGVAAMPAKPPRKRRTARPRQG